MTSQINRCLIVFLFYPFFKLIATCRFYVICVRDNNDSNVKIMTTWLIRVLMSEKRRWTESLTFIIWLYITRYCTQHCTLNLLWIIIQTHTMYLIAHPGRRAMGCLFYHSWEHFTLKATDVTSMKCLRTFSLLLTHGYHVCHVYLDT